MKLIFLDIDGVLNLRNRSRDKWGSLFHAKWVKNLQAIIDATDAKIIISSTWRKTKGDWTKNMQAMWKQRNLPGEVIGVTPFFWHTEYSSLPRGCEIEYVLEKQFNFHRINWSKESQLEYLQKTEVKGYVILDDDSDMLLSQKEHFVKTALQFDCKDAIEGLGLTKQAAEKAIKILNTSFVDLYYTT